MYKNNYLAYNLRKASQENSHRIFAKKNDGSTINYANFFHGAEQFAQTLISQGLQPNDRVVAQIEKSIEALQLYIGTILAGGVFIPLNTAYTATEINYFLLDATPTIFICSDKTLATLKPLAKEAGVTTIETLNANGSGSFAELAKHQAPFTEAVSREEDALAAILYTSGTTGRSKGAMLTHKNLWSNANTLKDCWHFSEKDILIHALPIFHTHGLFVATNVTLAAGASLIFMPSFSSDAIIKVMSHATVLMGVPTFYIRLLAHPALSKNSTKNMRLFISGSAPLLVETHQQWTKKTGHAILERYGMTETNMNTSNPYHGERRPGTVGLPLPDTEVRITKTGTEMPLAINEIGTIEVRGPNVFQGYWQMPEKTKEELRDNGFFITGDLGRIDEQGYISIIGRSKDLIITGGYNVYPKEVETIIDAISGIEESAVIGLPHPDLGEGVTAVIVHQANTQITEDDIKNGLKKDLAKYKQPKKIFFTDTLPRNTMGKVQKKALREKYSHTYSKN